MAYKMDYLVKMDRWKRLSMHFQTKFEQCHAL